MSKKKTKEKCIIDGCVNSRVYSNGLCPKHYQRQKRTGDPLYEKTKITSCKVEGCGRPYFSNGYCRSHDGQIRKHGKILKNKKFKELKDCSVEGCISVSFASGMCQKHYQRFKKYGTPEPQKINVTDLDEYGVWLGMIARCHHEKHKSYMYYGGRGIYVCDRWRNSFELFYQDMGPRPFAKAQIDRIKNEKGYEPGNCRWTTAKVNGNNKRSTVVTIGFIREVESLRDSGHKQAEIQDILETSRSSVQRAYRILRDGDLSLYENIKM